MMKQFLRRYLPNKSHLTAQRSLHVLGRLLYSGHLWHLSHRTVPRAVGVGLFCALLPLPMQMLLAAVLSIVVRANIPIAVALTWISNPFTTPFILYVSYKIGAWILQAPPQSFVLKFSIAHLSEKFSQLWQPLALGTFVCAVVVGLAGYVITHYIWQRQIVQSWYQRRQRRKRQGMIPPT